MRKMFEDGLNGIWGKIEHKWSKEDYNRWGRILNEGIWPFFETPRDIKRFLNAFGFYFQIHAREGYLDVNIVDLMIVEVLRIFDYRAYRIVAGSWSNRMPVNLLIYSDAKGFRRELVSDFDEFLEKSELNGVKKTSLKKLFHELLPQVQENTNVSIDFIDLMDRNRRLCHQRHFSKYFQLDLDPEDISAATITEFVKPTNSPEKLTGMVREAIQNGYFIRMLDRLRLEKDDISKSSIGRIGKALFDVSDKLPLRRVTIGFKDDSVKLLSGTVVNLLSGEKDQQLRNSVAETMVDLTHSITGPIHFVLFVQSKRHPNGSEFLSSDSLEKIKDMLVKRLWEFAESGKLWRMKENLSILYQFSRWGDAEKVRNWLNDEIKDPTKAATFVRRMLEESIGGGIIYIIRPNSWKKLVDLRKLTNSASEAAFEEPTKTAVEKLIRALDNAKPDGALPEEIHVINRLSDGTYESI